MSAGPPNPRCVCVGCHKDRAKPWVHCTFHHYRGCGPTPLWARLVDWVIRKFER